MDAMALIRTTAVVTALAGVLFLPAVGAKAQTAPSAIRLAQAPPPDATAPRHLRKPPTRLRVYPRYYRYEQWPDDVYPRYDPGPNAVRECNATYVQEYRPSGTVIVPRMSCHWRQG
jgi:hypothetical protein